MERRPGGLHLRPGCRRPHRLGCGDFRGENCSGEVTLSETVTRLEENVRFRKSHSGPRSLPKWDIREPSKKHLPPREKLPQLGEVIRSRGARCPPWRRPGRGCQALIWGPGGSRGAGSGGSGCLGGQSSKAGPRHGEGVISGQEAEAGSRWGGGGSHAVPRGGRGQRPGRARRAAGCGPDPACAPPASRPRASASALHSRAGSLPPQLPSAPSPRELRRPKLGEKFPNFRQARRSAPAPVPRLPAFPLGPQFRQPGVCGA